MDMDGWRKAREAVVSAALPHVPFDGWTEGALAEGALAAGMSAADAKRLFPRGAVEAIEVYSAMADRAMEEAVAAADPEAGVREKIALGLKARLDFATPHKEAVRRGAILLALPQNAGVGLRLVYRTVDALWYAAGDRATDFNHYTKRAILAGMCSATYLYWFNDRSLDHAATFAFLDQRLADHARFHGATERLKQQFQRFPNPFVFAERLRPERRRGRRGMM